LNLIAAAPLWLVILLACALVAAATEDAMRYRISNITSLVVVAGAICAAIIEGPTWSLWQNGAVFLGLLVVGTLAFTAGWLGGGDVKLFAATALWLDFRSAVWFTVLVMVAGGVVAIAYLLSRPFRRRGDGKIKGTRVPYGLAIAFGALAIILIDRGVMLRQSPQQSASSLERYHS
jgi:prepilin peptidase CpaA